MSPSRNAQFQKLYAENFKFIRSVLRKFPSLDGEAEDIIHDVFVKYHKHMHTVEAGKERAYLIVSARNLALDRLRQKKAHRTEAMGDDTYEDRASLWESDAAHELRLGVVARFLDEFIESEDEGHCFRLFYRDGKSMREIAEASDQPLGTVAARIYRLREKFRNRLRKQLEDL